MRLQCPCVHLQNSFGSQQQMISHAVNPLMLSNRNVLTIKDELCLSTEL